MSPKEKEPEELKIVDKRHSATKNEEPSRPKSGEGFVMKEKPEPPEEAAAPNEIDFSTLIFSLATGAIINLGLAPDPVTKKVQKNIELAKQNIDILEMLKAKTKGNLTPEESQLMENLLSEVKLKYVQAAK